MQPVRDKDVQRALQCQDGLQKLEVGLIANAQIWSRSTNPHFFLAPIIQIPQLVYTGL